MNDSKWPFVIDSIISLVWNGFILGGAYVLVTKYGWSEWTFAGCLFFIASPTKKLLGKDAR